MINSVCGYGSTGSICVDIASVLKQNGHSCTIAFGQGHSNYPDSLRFGSKLENHFHNLCSIITGKQGYFSKKGTKKLITFIKEYNPDVIHLHNLHGHYLNIGMLFEYLSSANKQVIWTLHDCWAFTGKCAYYSDAECSKWQDICHKCPQLKTYPPSLFFDQSKRLFEDKKLWFNSIKDLTFISVSNWLKNEVQKSFLKKNKHIVVYNWVDRNIFKPYKTDVRSKYDLDPDKFTIVGVSASWYEHDKKLKDFILLSKLISADMQIVLVGKSNISFDGSENIIHIPYINSSIELAKIYSSADVYVHTKTEDTFGKVIAEAMSCGTPAIVYNTTACPETIGDKCGYVVEKGNVNNVMEAINKIKAKSSEYYLTECQNHVKENFDYSTNINKIISLYNK